MAKGCPFWYLFLFLPKVFILRSFGLRGKNGKKLNIFFSFFSPINTFFGLIYRKIAYIYPKEELTEQKIEIEIPKFFPIFSIQRVPPLKMEKNLNFEIKIKPRYQNGQPLAI